MKNKELQNYIQAQISQSQKRLESLSFSLEGKSFFKRNIFYDLNDLLNNFLKKRSEPRIIVMPGLRGMGKTTLLAQLYLSLKGDVNKLYLSVEEAIKRFDVNLWDIIENYEELTGKHIEQLDKSLILFLDEIHYDKKWAFFLKSMYDRSRNIMIFCTGSSALLLKEQIDADVARRVYFVDINPVHFSEYMLLKHGKSPIKNIGEDLKNILFLSKNAKEIWGGLKKNEAKIKNYWLDVDKFEFEKYIKFGTFPFTLRIENEAIALDFISQIINKVIYADIPQFYSFEIETLNRIDKVLYLISDTLGVSLLKLSEALEIKPDTLRLILKSLETSGIISRVSPFGAHFKQVKKPSKYLFSTPSLRFSYLSSKESNLLFENYKGGLLEDIVCMYLKSALKHFSLNYDAREGGADFVISTLNRRIVLEVSFKEKSCKQVAETSQRIKSSYNLIVSNNDLEYSEDFNTVKIPLKYFLLM
ncbi:MAG: AAA family ATPase [Candidatus Pacebacteria bacterium]|nr:AAA family ATPase [Candidatus Paceibacterota bacterium]